MEEEDLNLSTTRDKLRFSTRDQRCHHGLRKLSEPQLKQFYDSTRFNDCIIMVSLILRLSIAMYLEI